MCFNNFHVYYRKCQYPNTVAIILLDIQYRKLSNMSVEKYFIKTADYLQLREFGCGTRYTSNGNFPIPSFSSLK